MTKEQVNEIVNGQRAVLEGVNKLLALFTLEPLNEATNPILNLSEAAKLLGVSVGHLSKACEDNEVPYRRLGSKYLFSRVALMAWLHNVNMSYLFEKMDAIKKRNNERFYQEDPVVVLNNWLRFTINPISGASEDFQLEFSETNGEREKVDTEVAANLLGISVGKMRDLASGFLYYKTPVIREGNKFKFPKDELLEWAKTPAFEKLKAEYIVNLENKIKWQKANDERREAERLEKEAKKKRRIEKKLSSIK